MIFQIRIACSKVLFIGSPFRLNQVWPLKAIDRLGAKIPILREKGDD